MPAQSNTGNPPPAGFSPSQAIGNPPRGAYQEKQQRSCRESGFVKFTPSFKNKKSVKIREIICL
jgi:hypothetical protein